MSPRAPWARRFARGASCLALAAVASAACGSSSADGGPLDPRFVAVHNTLSAMGMAEVGPVHRGTLAEGHEDRMPIALPAGCFTVVVLGGQGIRDIDATLLDPHGSAVAHDATREPEAALRACLDGDPGYVLAVKAAAGSGAWVAGTWAGGEGSSALASRSGASAAPEANGTCDAPIPLAPGVVEGSTTHGQHEYAGSCGPSDSRELVYELDVARREHVTIEVEARFDSVLYVRKDDCTDSAAEVDCNDDAPDRMHSRVDRVLDPGKYFVFVDGYGHDAGAFKLTLTASDVLALSDACRDAAVLLDGAAQSGTTAGMADDARATCGGGAYGADAVWRADIGTRSRVRVVEHSDEMTPVVHVRRACVEEDSEVVCGESGAASGDATVTGVLEAGTYAVFADAHEPDSVGRYTLLLQTAPLAGSGVPGDGCADAAMLAGASGASAGDTFAARDDVAGSCGGAGAADVVYRIDAPKRSRLVATLDGEEAAHLLVLRRRCADRASEVACGRALDEVVSSGTYYLAVDGDGPEALGRFTLHWALRDLSAQAQACAQAPRLIEGRDAQGTTAQAGDAFTTACASTDSPAPGAADRVYELVVPSRAKLRVTVDAAAFHPVLAVRKTCLDAPGAPPAEIACEADSDSDAKNHLTLERTFEPGTYWVVVDGQSAADRGPFRLEYHAVP